MHQVQQHASSCHKAQGCPRKSVMCSEQQKFSNGDRSSILTVIRTQDNIHNLRQDGQARVDRGRSCGGACHVAIKLEILQVFR